MMNRRNGTAGRRRLAAALASALLLGAPAVGSAQPADVGSIADLVDDLLDTVVSISTSQGVPVEGGLTPPQLPEDSPFRDFFTDEDAPLRETESIGSGFVIRSDGIIVTNYHVVEEADQIWAILNDGTRLAARLIGYDPPTDLAILRVNPARPLPAVTFGDSDALRIGDPVVAIGNPFGLGGTVTRGIVSARHRDINQGPYDDYLQTDASINRGNSGGPLFDIAGNVVGINTAILSDTGDSIGIAFAIPSAVARPILEQLIESGVVRRGRIGVVIQEVTDGLAEGFGLEQPGGALVVGLPEEGSPAVDAGVEVGDIIVGFDGAIIGGPRELTRAVAAAAVGRDVDLTVLRDGAEIALTIRIGERDDGFDLPAEGGDNGPPPLEGPLAAEALGLTVGALTPALRERFGIAADVDGVVITAIDPSGPAAERDLEVGNVIIEVGVGGDTVMTAEDVDARLAEEEAYGRGAIVLLIATADGEVRFDWIRITR